MEKEHIPLTSEQEQAMWELAQNSGIVMLGCKVLKLLEKELGSVNSTTIEVRKMISELNAEFNKGQEKRDQSGLQEVLLKRFDLNQNKG